MIGPQATGGIVELDLALQRYRRSEALAPGWADCERESGRLSWSNCLRGAAGPDELTVNSSTTCVSERLVTAVKFVSPP